MTDDDDRLNLAEIYNVQQDMAEGKVRAEREIGKRLAGNVKAGNPELSHAATIALKDVGLTRSDSSSCTPN